MAADVVSSVVGRSAAACWVYRKPRTVAAKHEVWIIHSLAAAGDEVPWVFGMQDAVTTQAVGSIVRDVATLLDVPVFRGVDIVIIIIIIIVLIFVIVADIVTRRTYRSRRCRPKPFSHIACLDKSSKVEDSEHQE